MIKRALPVLTLAILWLAQGYALALSALPVLPELNINDARSAAPVGVAPVRGSRVLRVRCEVKVMPGADSDVDSVLVPLRDRYGFVRDQGFEPQAVADDKEFSILPYPAQPRPIVYLVKGFVTETGLPQLARDRSVRKVEADGDAVAPTSEALHRFVTQYGALILEVSGVKSVSVGFDCGETGDHRHIVPHHDVIIVTLQPGADEASVRSELRKSVPALAVLPVRFVAPAAEAKGGRKHPGFRPVVN